MNGSAHDRVEIKPGCSSETLEFTARFQTVASFPRFMSKGKQTELRLMRAGVMEHRRILTLRGDGGPGLGAGAFYPHDGIGHWRSALAGFQFILDGRIRRLYLRFGAGGRQV